MIDFTNISYLEQGSEAQQQVFSLLTEFGILNKLTKYQPVLVGTFPLDILVAQSDVDIVCCYGDATEFSKDLESLFRMEDSFSIRAIHHLAEPAVVANFNRGGLPYEVFGQHSPVIQQMGYRHMLAEYAILTHFGEAFKQAVIRLKENGIKTEPAFCELLGITGDPYINLLEYKLPTDSGELEG